MASPTQRGSAGTLARATARRRATLKVLVLALVLVGLGVILGFSLSRELAAPTDSTVGAAAGAMRIPQRPALTSEEQAYVDALWPIHTDVEVAAERVSLGAIFYTTNDVSRTELQARLEQALASYRAAEQRLQALHPPESLRSSHETYLAAVALFEQSAVEMLRMFDDGSDQHLQAGYPPYLDGTNKIRDLGGKFWPDEFPPN